MTDEKDKRLYIEYKSFKWWLILLYPVTILIGIVLWSLMTMFLIIGLFLPYANIIYLDLIFDIWDFINNGHKCNVTFIQKHKRYIKEEDIIKKEDDEE